MSAPSAPGRTRSPRPRPRQRRQVAEARRRRLAVLVAFALVVGVTLSLTAFGSGGATPSAAGVPPASATRLLPAGPPTAQVIARVGLLQIDLPVNQTRVTAIGYYGSADGSLALSPVGTQANAGLITRLAHKIFGGGSGNPRWYQLPGGQGPDTTGLDVGGAPGTDIYSPVDGTVVGIGKVIVDGKVYGQQIDIQPTSAPSIVVSVSRLTADPALTVGTTVFAHSSKLGEILDFSKVEQQSLARYTNDSGDHVLLEVRSATTLTAT